MKLRNVLAVLFAATGVVQAQSMKTLDLSGTIHEIGSGRPTAVVFVGTECPISNSYVPALNAMAHAWDDKGVQLIGVVSDPTVTRKAAADWGKTYDVQFPLVLDASGELARRLKPSHTPDAFLLGKEGEVRYEGRIDDSWATVGQKRQAVSSNDLDNAVTAVLAGSAIATPHTDVVGCAFEPWGKDGRSAAPVTWSRDVAPIVYANCIECHRTGEVAPFSLETYQDVRKRSKQVAEIVHDGLMPPWKPTEGFGHFTGERRLTDDQRETIRRWAEGGAVEGDESDAPAKPVWTTGWRLGPPDLVLQMSEPYEIPAGGKDIYRAFVIPVDLKQDEMIVASEFKPGNARVVHHSLLFMDESGKARQLDAADPAPGYKSFGGPGFAPSGGLGGWAPGARAERLPDGTGRPIHKGADIVFQMHYHPDGKVEQDQSQLALYFAKKPVTQSIGSVVMGKRQIVIPAGESHYVRQQSITLPADTTFVGIIPHMHLLGHEMKVVATTPAGKIVPMIWIRDWDFQWQGQYRYVDPLVLPKGTRIDMTASYDNSEANPANPNKPPKEVRFGEQTTDEMCYCFFEVAGDAAELKKLRRDIVSQQMVNGLLNR